MHKVYFFTLVILAYSIKTKICGVGLLKMISIIRTFFDIDNKIINMIIKHGIWQMENFDFDYQNNISSVVKLELF